MAPVHGEVQTVMGTPICELACFVPWTEGGFHDEVLYGSGMGLDGSPLMVTRCPPALCRGPDGTPWLVGQGQIMRTQGRDGAEFVSVAAADIDGVADMAPIVPMEDGGVVLTGRKGDDNILARLSRSGDLIWRKVWGPRAAAEVHLLGEREGAVYLYAPGEQGGRVASVSVQDGAGMTALSLQGRVAERMWMMQGRVFWVEYADRQSRWVSRDLDTGLAHAVSAAAPLDVLLGTAVAALPDGGALLAVPENAELIWLSAAGYELHRMTIAGLVRTADGLAIAQRKGEDIRVCRWGNGEIVASYQLVAPGPTTMLMDAEEDRYYFRDSQTIFAVNARGERVGDAVPFDMAQQRWQRLGRVDVCKTIAGPDGALLLAGADSAGAFVVRVKS